MRRPRQPGEMQSGPSYRTALDRSFLFFPPFASGLRSFVDRANFSFLPVSSGFASRAVGFLDTVSLSLEPVILDCLVDGATMMGLSFLRFFLSSFSGPQRAHRRCCSRGPFFPLPAPAPKLFSSFLILLFLSLYVFHRKAGPAVPALFLAIFPSLVFPLCLTPLRYSTPLSCWLFTRHRLRITLVGPRCFSQPQQGAAFRFLCFFLFVFPVNVYP